MLALVGSLAVYFAEPREPTSPDLELASAFTETAAIIVARDADKNRDRA